MANKKLTIEETACRKQADELEQFTQDPQNPPESWRVQNPATLSEGEIQKNKEKIIWYRSRAYQVTSAVNTVEWTLGQYLSIQQVEEIIGRTGHDAVDVSVKKNKGD